MTKELITRLLTGKQVSEKDLNEFIADYTFLKLDRHISGQELSGIAQFIKMGYFDLRFALLEAARSLDLNVMSAFDRSGVLLKTYVYESF